MGELLLKNHAACPKIVQLEILHTANLAIWSRSKRAPKFRLRLRRYSEKSQQSEKSKQGAVHGGSRLRSNNKNKRVTALFPVTLQHFRAAISSLKI